MDPSSTTIFLSIMTLITLMLGGLIAVDYYDRSIARSRDYEVRKLIVAPDEVEFTVYFQRRAGFRCISHTETLRGKRELLFETGNIPEWAFARVSTMQRYTTRPRSAHA
ncbi:MAG: hypothetical protein XU15_C0011G0094 [candidate division NC10 bacterium CSP1-5]|nr:MAG: hypothetical protein XU15_C0011G0094 [candidate division NC10 bacterium CSP1-5]